MQRINNIIRCPETNKPLEYVKGAGFKVEGTETFYTIKEGILDLTVSNPVKINEEIGIAYDKSTWMYDDYMNSSKLHLRILKRILLGMGREDTDKCAEITSKLINKLRGGIVLDLPVGTGIFTTEEYIKHPDIIFVVVDYSWGMLRETKKKVDALKAPNVLLIRADVGRLPFINESFDGVLTLNGIHSFQEKEKAIRELARVLKRGQNMFGSLCLKGERRITDIMMELFYFPGKWFTKPALTKKEFLEILEKHALVNTEHHSVGPGLIFESTKR